MQCRNCKLKSLKRVVKIGDQPISSLFYKKKKYKLKKYSLDLYKCKNCNLVQFFKSVPINKMYGQTYGYQTSISKLMISHLKNKIKYFKSKKIIRRHSSVLDIGSNDGTFLNLFKNSKNLFGIDPSSEKFKKLYRKDIHRINDFFSQKNIRKYLKKNNIKTKKFDLITSFAIFYDINDPNSFCKDIYNLLTPKGFWAVEFSYLPLMLKNLTYDQICHEHVAYYSLKVFNSLLNQNNLKIIDVSLNEINGGSIEVICARKENVFKSNHKKINLILKDENLISRQSFRNFNKRIDNVKKNLNKFFKKNRQRTTIGYGASTKGNIVLNHCKINNKKLNYVCDANRIKHGMYTPGANIKIISKEKMHSLRPDYLLVLIWPFRKEVIKQEMGYLKNGGKMVFHLPKFHIVDQNNYKYYLNNSFKKLSYNY